MTVIELPDQQVAALKAKAAAQGFTVEAWLKKLSDGGEAPAARQTCRPRKFSRASAK